MTCAPTHQHHQGGMGGGLAVLTGSPHVIHLYMHAMILTCVEHTHYLPRWAMAKRPIRIIAGVASPFANCRFSDNSRLLLHHHSARLLVGH